MQKEFDALQKIPQPNYYEKSFAHTTLIQETLKIQKKQLLISLSIDGNLKFWIKTKKLFEIYKTENFHNSKIKSIRKKKNEEILYTLSNNGKEIKMINLNTIDLIKTINLDFIIKKFLPFKNSSHFEDFLVIDEKEDLRIVSGLKIFGNVKNFVFCKKLNCVIFLSGKHFLEYLDVDDWKFVGKKNGVFFSSKFDTDLFCLKKKMKGKCLSMVLDEEEEFLSIYSSYLEIFIFDTKTGKLILELDTSYQFLIKSYPMFFIKEKHNLEKKMLIEDDLIKKLNNEKEYSQKINFTFDETKSFIIFPFFGGILIYSIKAKKPIKILANKEKERYISTTIYNPKTEKVDNIKSKDTIIISYPYKRGKFCLFTLRPPINPDPHKKAQPESSRDIPDNSHPKSAPKALSKAKKLSLSKRAIISTTLGSIHIELFPKIAPLAVQNFLTHSKNNYYTNCLFHRVVPGYVQTGDPRNDGTGGESIWGKEFRDEIGQVFHDRPFCVSMANSGRDGNGSQFFITTVPSPWLDGKHTIFGRVFKGSEVVTEIEALRTDNFEKPYMDVRILNVFVI